jgi:hypothetical protein
MVGSVADTVVEAPESGDDVVSAVVVVGRGTDVGPTTDARMAVRRVGAELTAISTNCAAVLSPELTT